MVLFPAYAGVILRNAGRREGKVAFPRIRGGDPRHLLCSGSPDLLFPAYAGVIPNDVKAGTISLPFPRIRGGDPVLPVVLEQADYFSPHTRG